VRERERERERGGGGGWERREARWGESGRTRRDGRDVTRGKSPRAIFPHIIIREGLGVSMATHTPPSSHPSTPGTLTGSPTYIQPLIHSAPRLLICRRTHIGTYARTRTRVCARGRAREASDGSWLSCIGACVCIHIHICRVYVFACCVFERVSPARRERKGRREGGETRVSEFVPVPQTRRVFIRRDGKSGAEGEDGKRMKLMYLFCGHPHMLLGERRAGSPREDLTARRMAETTWPGSAAEYQPCVIAFVCKGRLFPSRATSSIATHPHPASRFFMARKRASLSRSPTCR